MCSRKKGILYMNEIINNYTDMSDLEILANGQNGITVVLTRMVNENKKRDTRIALLEKSDEAKAEEISKIKEKMDYIASPENSIMYRELVAICRNRVNKLLNSTNDGLYKNFWKPYLNKNIHTVLCTHFNVGSDKYIKTKYFEEAKQIAHNYLPSDYYLKSKVDDLLNDKKNGVLDLSKDRMLSFKLYTKESNDGKINLFTA